MLQIRELKRQLLGLFRGGEGEQVGVFLDAQRLDQLVGRVDAGIDGLGAVIALYPEDRDLEQKVDRHKRTHGQHGQHAERPQQTAAVLCPYDLRLCDAARAPWRAGAVACLLGIDLLRRALPQGRMGSRRGPFRRRFGARGVLFFKTQAAAHTAAGLLGVGAVCGFLPAAALVAVHKRLLSGEFWGGCPWVDGTLGGRI